MNATAVNGLAAVGDLWSVMITNLLLTVILVIGALLLIFGNFARYRKFRGFMAFLGRTFMYFGKGLIALSIFGTAYLGILTLGMGMGSGAIRLDQILFWAGAVIGGFFGIAGLGYAFDRFVLNRTDKFGKKYKKEK